MFWRESVLLQQLDMIPTSATQYPLQEIYDITHTYTCKPNITCYT